MKSIFIVLLSAFCAVNTLGQAAKKSTTKKIISEPKREVKIRTTDVTTVTDEEYKIYLAVLGKDREMFVVRDKTGIDDTAKNYKKSIIREALRELSDETYDDFKVKAEKQASLEKKFPTRNNYTLISLDELKKSFAYVFDDDINWDKFYQEHPKSRGIYTFSRVGFNRQGSQALVFVTNWCRSLCGEGNFYLLEKENEEWKVVENRMIWIS